MKRNAAHARKIVEQNRRTNRADAAEQTIEELHDALVRRVAKEERRHDQRGGEAELGGGAREPHRIGERCSAGAAHRALARYAGRDGFHQSQTLIGTERHCLAGRTEQIDAVRPVAQ